MTAKRRLIIQMTVVWCLGVVSAGVVVWWQQEVNETTTHMRFSALANEVEAEVLKRMFVYEHGLKGARGAIIGATGRGITRKVFSAYSESRELQREFPGSRGFGFIRRVITADEAQFVAAARRDGAPQFTIKHLGPVGPELWVIQYIESADSNRPAVGLNIASEPNRRAAATLAMETGTPVMTAPITLVQSDSTVLQSVLVLQAVYQTGMPTSTRDERRAATLGWTYTPLELPQVLRGIEGINGAFTLDLWDMDHETQPVRLYQTPTDARAPAVSTKLTHQAHLLVFGREWKLTVKAQPPFIKALNHRSPLAVGLSVLAGWTFLTLLWHLRRISEVNRNALLNQQTRLAAVVNGSNDAVVVKTMKGIITDWNPAAERIFGFSAQEAIGQPMAQMVFPPNLFQEEADILAEISVGHEIKAFDTVRLHRDGHAMDMTVAVFPIFNTSGKTVGAASVMRDVSEQKAAQKRILELNEALAQQVSERALREQVLLDQALSSIIVTNEKGTVVLFNPMAEKLLGYKAEEVVGTEVMSKFHDPTEVKNRVKQASKLLGRPLGPGEVFLPHVRTLVGDRSEWLYVHKDGTRIPVLLTVGALRDGQGRLSGFIGISSDLREQKKLERELTQAVSASAAKDLFLATVSHEMRTPLNAMIGLSHLLAQTHLSAEQHELLGKVQVASNGLLGLINDVLDLSKIEAGEMHLNPVVFDLPAVVQNALSLVETAARTKGLTLELHLPDNLPRHLLGDDGRLCQIITNLLANAVKFTARGTVSLHLSALPTRDTGVVRLRMAVQDTGIGIAPDVQARLFTPFVQADSSITRDYGGTGLGLSIVRNLVDMMGGEVGVTSALGQGSEFWFTVTLPVAAPVTQNPTLQPKHIGTAQPAAKGQRLAGLHVLLVDDSDINREVGSRILCSEGARVSHASNGQEALDWLANSAHPAVHIVLMDLQMPVMDGCTAAQLIRTQLGMSDLPIVALTAWSMDSVRIKALEAGMTEFIAKPFDPAAMIDHVLRLAHAGRPTSQAMNAPDLAMLPSPDPALWKRLTSQLHAEHHPWLIQTVSGVHMPSAELQQKLHKLMGSAGMLGHTALYQAVAALQTTAHSDTPANLRERLHHIAGLLQDALDGIGPGTGNTMETPGSTAYEPTTGDWELLQQRVQQQSLEALDLYQRLRPWLLTRLESATVVTMDQAMARLNFTQADEWLQANQKAITPLL